MLSSLYEVDELLDLGLDLKVLGIDKPDIEEVEEKSKKKKLKMCPQCGCEF